ncbi:L-xylulose reductase-like protein, partial [Leptotrombidium deliense]
IRLFKYTQSTFQIGKIRRLISQIGSIVLLVNNAGILKYNSIGNISEEEVNSNHRYVVYAAQVKAVVNITQEVAKGMIDHKRVGCSIVNVSSAATNVTRTEYLIYGAAKAAIDQITRVSALELGKHQTRVNAIQTGAVLTDMHHRVLIGLEGAFIGRAPLHRAALVIDVTNFVVYLLSDKADMITGACIPIDGCYTAC